MVTSNMCLFYLTQNGGSKLFYNVGGGDPLQALLEGALCQQAACQLGFHFQEEIKGPWCKIWQIMELGERIDCWQKTSSAQIR